MKLPSLNFGDLSARLPIIQGGMGVGISLSGLASAVANEGGVGVIATSMIGMRDPQRAKDPIGADRRGLIDEIRKARAKMTDGLLGVNIMCALTNYGDMVRTSIREKVDLIISGAGLPLDLPGYLREMSGEMKEELRTKLVPIVSSGRAASILCRKWANKFDYLPDGFVVEGPKAGGHLGFKAEQIDDPDYQLEKILAEVVEAVTPFREQHKKNIPVIAAGGVYTGEDIARFLEMGASGVQMGTRFVATKECDADEAFKQAYVNAHKEDVTIIKSPVGMPGRALKNAFLDAVASGLKKPKKCMHKCLHSCAEEKSPYCIAQALVNAYKGRLKHGFAFAGANAYLVDKIVTVKELMTSLREDAERKFQEAEKILRG
ncbi:MULTISPECIES: nitronate monooxygenase family protein [unclassified Pseudodesulfovibrio]|uniref:NAD(P)H-dependent flavin oxidoreductase n=1 Tax=unclassified Pseudodesulfovibrio TaxID=2661612 RepID=UPI000FEB7678|nr:MULTISPECIES: nitronate monooxygenase family protein [unclassified Pseudodesulfovibrio]MCJ2163300.1 nitronate monooxygenase family protein [Pseudodesulfovibrio sp. S3-i]RWU07279.1 nitronate monooxygenase [Pseudodesulfovibrio sp. S3]